MDGLSIVVKYKFKYISSKFQDNFPMDLTKF